MILIPERKEELLQHLRDNEIGFLGHDAPYYPDYPKLNLKFNLPKTKLYLEQQVRLPVHPYLKDEEVRYVIANIRSFFGK